MNENELKKFAGLGDFLNNTDFAYQLGSTGKYALPAGALATLLGSYLNWSKAKDTKVEGETEDERRRRLWRSAIVPATLGGLATLGTTAGLAALNTSSDPLSDKSITGFSNLFKTGLKGDSSNISRKPEPSDIAEFRNWIHANVPKSIMPAIAGGLGWTHGTWRGSLDPKLGKHAIDKYFAQNLSNLGNDLFVNPLRTVVHPKLTLQAMGLSAQAKKDKLLSFFKNQNRSLKPALKAKRNPALYRHIKKLSPTVKRIKGGGKAALGTAALLYSADKLLSLFE